MNDVALYKVGELITELVEGLNLSVGLIYAVNYDTEIQEYIYVVWWNDMFGQSEITESILRWRIENKIFGYFPVNVEKE